MNTVIMSAGGEEPSSLIAGAIFHLLKNHSVLERAQGEVRSAFRTADDINHASMDKLIYLKAVLDEVHRIRPPGAGHFSRRTQRPEVIDGYHVPPDVSLTFYSAHKTKSP